MSVTQTEKKTILVVDDDPFIQRLFRKTLEREAFVANFATDGAAAIELLPQLAADLIILDLMLPKVNGLKVLEAIRAESRTKDLPVLILSNAYLPEVAKKAMKAGANMGLPKSECSPARLVSLVREMVTGSQGANSKEPTEKKSLFSRLLNNKPEAPRPSGGDLTMKPADSLVVPETRSQLAKEWQTDIAAIREHCLLFVKSCGTQDASEHLFNLYSGLRYLSARAAIGRCTSICQLAGSFEAMLFEHVFKLKGEMSPSVTQTMVQAVDCLEHLFKTGAALSINTARKPKVLLVDDDAVCNSTNDIALRRADFETVCVTDGMAALALCETTPFDLVLLDINMPVLSGFEVCEKIRAFPPNKQTPVIFVTLHGDFKNRAQSVLSGASGLITKPISPLELIVKAMVFLLRTQRQGASKEAPTADKNVAPAPTSAPLLIPMSPETVRPKNGDASPEKHLPLKLADDKQSASHQTNRIAEIQPKLEGRVKELKATQAAVDERVKALTEALAAETKRRQEAEKQAAANAKRRGELEGALAENEMAQKSFAQLLEKSRQQAQTGSPQKALDLDGQARQLEAVRIFVEEKNNAIAKALAAETKRREAAQKQAAEYERRRSELESALASSQQAKEGLLREIEAAADPRRRSELEAALRENARKQSTLLEEMEATRQKLQPQTTPAAGTPEEQIAQLKAALAAVEAKVKTLSEELAEQKKLRESAERNAGAIDKNHRQLEAELAENKRTQQQVRQDLEAAQKELQALAQRAAEEQSKLAAAQKAAELAAAEQKTIRQQMQTLTGSLKIELERRQTAEKQGIELAARRDELEKEIARHTQAEKAMRAELLERQQQLEAQAKNQQAEQAGLAARTKELEAAQSELAKLKVEHEKIVASAHSLTESLKNESSQRHAIEKQADKLAARRTELEESLVERTQGQERLQAELAQQKKLLEGQGKAYEVELTNLTKRTAELETALAALGKLKSKHAIVTKQADSLAASLKTESSRREAAEKEAAELTARRAELEQSLEERTQAQGRLQAELAAHKKQLEGQGKAYEVELTNLTKRTAELEAAQVALTELKSKHATVAKQADSLATSLKTESSRREAAEKQAAELEARRTELEQNLVERTQAQERLQAELTVQKKLLESQGKRYHVEAAQLKQRTAELETGQAALAELQSKHASVVKQVDSLEASLKTESVRCKAAEKQVAELARQGEELEQDLTLRTQEREQLQKELVAERQQFGVQQQASQAELDNLKRRTERLETAEKTLAELRAQHANVGKQADSLAAALRTESARREAAEKQAAELSARRTELERSLAKRTQAQERLEAELAEQQKQIEGQGKTYQVELANLAKRSAELETAQGALTELKSNHAAVAKQAESLATSLKTECSRREAAEKRAVELAKQRGELELALSERAQRQEHLQKEVAAQQAQLEAAGQAHTVEISNWQKRTKEIEAAQGALAELQSTHAQVIQKSEALADALAKESNRCKSLEQQVAELAIHRSGLEKEVVRRTEVEEHLRAELATQTQSLQVRAKEQEATQRKLATQAQELNATQNSVTELQAQLAIVRQQVHTLKESWQAETKRAAAGEKQIAGLITERTAIEAELAKQIRVQKQLRDAFDDQQERVATQTQIQKDGEATLAARTKELEAAQATATGLSAQHAILLQQCQTLNASLTNEAAHRERAEKQAAELAIQRTRLEQEFATRTQAAQRLQAEVTDQGKQLEVHLKRQESERATLAARSAELETTQQALSKLRAHVAQLNDQLKALTHSLQGEASRREAAEARATELARSRAQLEADVLRRTRAYEALQADVAGLHSKLDFETRAHASERGQLTAQAEELKAAQAARAELEVQHASVCAQVETLTGRLQSEEARCLALETQATKLAGTRAELERELAERTQAHLHLSDELAKRQQQLQAQETAHQHELQTLNAGLTELETMRKAMANLTLQHAAAQREAEGLAKALKTETNLRATAERHAAELGDRRTALERELSAALEAQEQLSNNLTAHQQRLTAQRQAHKADLEALAERTREMKSAQVQLLELRDAQVTVSQRSDSLASALAVESGRREALEQEAATLATQRAKAEQNLAQHIQVQQQLRAEVAEQQSRLSISAGELEAFRNREVTHASKQQRLAEHLAEVEAARKELTEQLAASRTLAASHEKSIQALGSKIQQRTEEFQRLDMLLRTEVTHRHRLQTQLANAEAQLAVFGRQLGQMTAAQQAWLKRESELQSSLRFHQDEAARAGAMLAEGEAEIRQARAKIEELLVLQSALVTKVRELDRKYEAATAQLQEFKTNLAQVKNTAALKKKRLATMRYAILDAARNSQRRQRERARAGQQQIAALKQLLWTLENTPLSTAQRRMLAEVQTSIGNFNHHGSDEAAPYPVELPELHEGEFCATEVIESAFRIVREQSAEADIAARTSASGATGGTLYGDAVYIHQLIVLLASSPMGLDDVSGIDLRVGIERMTPRSADLTVRVALATKTSAQNLRARLEFLSAASANLKAAAFGEAESGLAAGWQLAQALGAQAAIETENENEVCMTLLLPIEMKSRIPTTTHEPVLPRLNGIEQAQEHVLKPVPSR